MKKWLLVSILVSILLIFLISLLERNVSSVTPQNAVIVQSPPSIVAALPPKSTLCNTCNETELEAFTPENTEQVKPSITLTPVPSVTISNTPKPENNAPTYVDKVRLVPDGGYNPERHFPRMPSLWQVGLVTDQDRSEWDYLFVASTDNQILEVMFGDVKPDIWYANKKEWTAPLPLGTITITNATGVKGILTFTSTSGHTGTFDMATETWHIDK